MTTHATLAIGRHKYVDIAATVNGREVVLTEEDARAHWNSVTDQEQGRLFFGEKHARFRPHFEQWWNSKKVEHRTWQAAFVTATENQAVALDSSMDWAWGFPVGEAARLLDHYSAAGWRIVHVSEDHGLYAGADAANEAYPARVRYLLAKD